MGYCSSSDVAALTRHIVSGACDFSTSTSPTLVQVDSLIASGSTFINSLLKGHGYSPPASTDDIYATMTQANAVYAAALTERSRTTGTTGPGENTRADMFWNDFKFLMEMLGISTGDLDLSGAGLGTLNAAGPYAGGISVDDVETIEGDTDRVSPRFVRGQFRHSGTNPPRKTTYTG